MFGEKGDCDNNNFVNKKKAATTMWAPLDTLLRVQLERL
jgi:hypothetical protein